MESLSSVQDPVLQPCTWNDAGFRDRVTRPESSSKEQTDPRESSRPEADALKSSQSQPRT